MYKILFNKKSAELEQMLKSKFVKCKNERCLPLYYAVCPKTLNKWKLW